MFIVGFVAMRASRRFELFRLKWIVPMVQTIEKLDQPDILAVVMRIPM